MASKVVGNLIVNLAANIADFRSDMKRAATDAERRMEQISNAQRKNAKVVEQSIKRQEAAQKRLQDGLKNLAYTFGVTFAAIGLSKLVGITDQYNLLSNRLQLVTRDSKELARVQASLFTIAQDTRQSLFATTELFVRLAQNSETVGASTEEILRFTETLQKLVIISGANVTEAKAAIIQLAQAMASGQLRGEELRSVMEQLPAVAKKLADQLTGGNIGAFRKMAFAGKVSANDVLTSILAVSAETDKAFNSMAITVGQAWQKLKNEFIQGTSQFNNSLSINRALAESIVVIADNLGTLANAIAVVAAVITARLLSSLTASIAAWIANTHQVILYQSALARMAGVSRVAAAGIGLMAGATRVLSGAMALLGGPAGVIFLAVAALSAWVVSSQNARMEMEQQSQKVKDLYKDWKDLTDAQKEHARNLQRGVIADITEQISDLRDELKGLQKDTITAGGLIVPGASDTSPAVIAIQAAIDTKTQELVAAREQLQKLLGRFKFGPLEGKQGEATAGIDTANVKYSSLADTLGLVEYKQKAYQQLLKEAGALTASVATEQEKYNATVEKYQAFLDNNLISQETFNRLMADLKDSQKDAADGFNIMQAAAEQAGHEMQSALADFFMDFDGGVKGMLKGFLDAMRKMIAQMLAFKTMQMLLGGTPVGDFFSIPARATGGPVQAGQPYLVGERGPELMVPNVSGTVIPNNKMGGQSVTVNMPVDARGAMSPEQIQMTVQAAEQRIYYNLPRVLNGYAPV